jgi:hypothetical protein
MIEGKCETMDEWYSVLESQIKLANEKIAKIKEKTVIEESDKKNLDILQENLKVASYYFNLKPQ